MIKNISIKNMIFFGSSLLVIFSLVITAFLINTVSYNVNINNATNSNRRELALITNNLNSQLNHIYNYAVSIAVNPGIITSLEAHPALSEDNVAEYAFRKELNKTINSIMGLGQNVYMWDLVSPGGQFYQIGGYYNMNYVKGLLDEAIFREARNKLSVSLFGPYLMNGPTDRKPIFLVIKPIVNLDSQNLCGYILFVIKETTFASVFENNMPSNSKSMFYILDSDNTVISSSAKQYITRDFTGLGMLSDADMKRLKTARTLIKKVDKVQMLYSIEENISKIASWTVISSQPLDILLAGQYFLNRSILLIGTLACIMALALSFLVSRSISRPILQLAHTIHDAAEGDMSQKADKHIGGEIQVLYSGFNNLMNTVNQLLRQVYREQEEKSRYQFYLIQEQIKPHFLYNTLEMIKSLIELEMNDTAGLCISALASFYRLSLNSGNDIITISEELKLSEQYMYIQKLRYIEYLDYNFDIPQELGQYYLPKMTLQPILENAIYHGIKEKQARGMIEIVLSRTPAHLIFIITDNGAGMDANTLSELRHSIGQSNHPEKSEPLKAFGLTSINRRLRLLYGEKYRFEIDSVQGKYTKVIISIPLSTPVEKGVKPDILNIRQVSGG